jgi:hypothetical protein
MGIHGPAGDEDTVITSNTNEGASEFSLGPVIIRRI